MRKKISLFLLACFISVLGWAQPAYECIDAVQTGFFNPAYQTLPLSNITVTIYKTGGGMGAPNGCGMSSGSWVTPYPPGTAFCNTGPYYIGIRGCPTGWYYRFYTDVTDIRMHMVSLNDSDTVQISIPPPPGPGGFRQVIPVTTAMLTAWTSSCNGTFKAVPVTSQRCNGCLSALGAVSGYSDVQVDVQNPFPPYTIPRFEVRTRGFDYQPNNDGVVYDICVKNDSCSLHFDVRADSPRCSNRPIKLHATDFPNTTHKWITTASGWTSSGANPIIPNATILMNGWYIDSATRGACKFLDSVFVNIDNTPVISKVTQDGPKCPGEDDTIRVSANLPVGGDYWFYGYVPKGPVGPAPAPNNQNYLPLPLVSKLDEGTYFIYAESPNGCRSDTVGFNFLVNDNVTASFAVTPKLGCYQDTVDFTNFSTGSSIFNWDFGDGTSGQSQLPDTTHIYPRIDTTWAVTLTVGNGICADDTTINVVFNHPLNAKISVDFDSVCQNTTLNFKNETDITPATVPYYFWDFKDGATSTTLLDTISHFYSRTGVYIVELHVQDFLGCKDTARHTILIDSVGSISYASTESAICMGKTINFYGTYSPLGIISATWKMGDGTEMLDVTQVVHAYDKPGTYTVEFDANYRICPDTNYTTQIVVKPYPTVDLGNDTAICPQGQPVFIKDVVNAGSATMTWRWNTTTKDSSDGIFVYHPGTYSVTVDDNGCATTDSVKIYKKCYLDIPNVFTPNGDGSNDYFMPRELLSRGVTKFNMSVFNRWGQIVFQTKKTDGRGWDGKFNDEVQPTSVYIYLIEAEFINGDSEKYQGNVTLIR